MLNWDTVLSPTSECDDPIIFESMVVVSIFPTRDRIWLLPYLTSGKNKTASPDRKPQEFSLSDILSGIKNQELETNQLQLESYKDVPEEYLFDSKGQKLPSTKERDRRYKIVCAALVDEDELFYAIHGKGVVSQVAKQFGVTRRNVQRYLNEYFRGGRHINSLIPRTGRHKRDYKPGSAKVGALPKTAPIGVIGKNVDKRDRDKMLKVLKKYYLNKSLKSLEAVYQRLLDEEYALVKGKILSDGSLTPTIHVPVNEQVSLDQLRYWMPRVLGMSRNDIRAARRQSATQKSNYSGRSGDGNYIPMGPGHIFQMDSTEIDIKLVSPYDRRIGLTKVTTYAVRDLFTRSFVGLHLAAGKASWYEARLALLNTFRNKKIVAAECGLIIDEEDWIESGIPQILLVDNEEFANKISTSVGKDLGLIVQFSRAYSGDDKGLVEASFHMFHAMMKNQNLAGFQYKNLIGRNRQLPVKTAALTPRELNQILILYVIYHNNYIWKDDYPMEAEASRDGVPDICREYWAWGLEHRNFFLREKPLRTLYLSLLEVGKLTVHRTHLMLVGKQLKYRSKDVRLAAIQDKVRGKTKKPELSCRYLRSTVNHILIELNGEFVIGELDSDMQRYLNMSHNEFQAARSKQDIKKKMHEHKARSATSALNLKIENTNQQAVQEKKAFLDSQPDSPVLDTKSATEVQISDSYRLDNARFDEVVETLSGNTSQRVDTENNIQKIDTNNFNDSPDKDESDSQLTESINILNSILTEINHG